jgi:5-methylthioadenosine/S-adenosylhomocysteine deaminase
MHTKTILQLFIGLFLYAPLLNAQNTKVHYDIVIKNTRLVDVLNKRVLEKRTIAIHNGKIINISDGTVNYSAKKVIDGSRLIALPGFINTHTHLWQHICKGCFPKESLQAWVRIYRTIHYLEPQQLRKVVLAASAEALLSGITTVSDYASLGFNDYAFEVNANSMKEIGLGGVIIWHNPSIFLPDTIKQIEIERLREKYKSNFSVWMGHGPLSFHSIPQVYSGLKIAKDLGMNISEHTMENNQEQKDFYNTLSRYFTAYKGQLSLEDSSFLAGLLKLRKPSGVDAYEEMIRDARKILSADDQLVNDSSYTKLTKEERQLMEAFTTNRSISPLELLEYLHGLKDFLSIHSVWPEKEDFSIMKRNNISISHNPESNMYLSSGIAPVKEYVDEDIPITIGTDGAASNDGINFFSAMRAMWNLYKLRAMNTSISSNMDEWVVIQAATINGAKALKIDGNTGSLDVGKEADIILLSIDQLGMSPLRPEKVLPIIIYSASPADVKYVISNGKIVVEEGTLKYFKEKELSSDLSRIANEVDVQIKQGKVWVVNQTFNSKNLATYWYTYRSVRSADSVNIKLSNILNTPVTVTVFSSAATFGGGTAYVVDTEVANRFPEKPAAKAFKETIIIQPGETFQLLKDKGKNDYRLISKVNVLEKHSDIGQLLMIVENK